MTLTADSALIPKSATDLDFFNSTLTLESVFDLIVDCTLTTQSTSDLDLDFTSTLRSIGDLDS